MVIRDGIYMGIYILCAVPADEDPTDTNMIFEFSFDGSAGPGIAERPTHYLHRLRRSCVLLGSLSSSSIPYRVCVVLWRLHTAPGCGVYLRDSVALETV